MRTAEALDDASPVIQDVPAATAGEAESRDISIVPAIPLALGGIPQGTLRWSYDDGGGAFAFETELVADLAFTELEPVRDEDLLDIESSRAFAVTGTLRHVAEATSCDGDESRCRIISLGDADLVGIAVRRGDTLTIELDWRTFGAESLAARPEAVVALRWSEIGYLGVAESLEASGAIGTPMVLSLSSHGGRQLAWARGGVAARGALDVWVG